MIGLVPDEFSAAWYHSQPGGYRVGILGSFINHLCDVKQSDSGTATEIGEGVIRKSHRGTVKEFNEIVSPAWHRLSTVSRWQLERQYSIVLRKYRLWT